MTENDYLNPIDIKEQCDAAIMRLERDNEALTRVENALEQFITDDEIKSVAYDALKQQISDYKVLLQAMQNANCSDISDFTVLKASVGDDVLIGADILAQKQASWDARISDENAAEGYRRASYTAEWPWVSQYYSWMADHYERMVQIDIQLYNEWQAKEDAFNAIEASTRGLFQCSAQLRQTAQNGLQSITGAFSNGTYVPDMGATWREAFSVENRVKWYSEHLKNIGYTQGEIDAIVSKGIILTGADIGKIKETQSTEKIYVTGDSRALIYNGKVYYIDVPTNQVAFQPIWELDAKRELGKMQFNAIDGILGTELEDIPKEEIYTQDGMYQLQGNTISGKDVNSNGAIVLHLFMGLESFMVSALNHTEVKICFESSGDARKVTIAVGDFQTRQSFQNINYNQEINTYQESSGVQGKQMASNYAARIYEIATGESIPDINGTYTIIGNLDSRHKDSMITGYLSYSEEGKLLYTPLVFPGDKAYVARCDVITGFQPEIIWDFSDKLTNATFATEEMQRIFERALEED